MHPTKKYLFKTFLCSLSIWFSSVTVLFSSEISAQSSNSIPQDFDYSPVTQALLDAGLGWELNSLFHPVDLFSTPSIQSIHYQPINRFVKSLAHGENLLIYSTNDNIGKLNVYGLGGIEMRGQSGNERQFKHISLSPFFWGRVSIRDNWYARLYVRLTNETASLPHYTGIPRSIARAGMNTGEFDQAAIGYQNEWALVEFGRGREIWGPSPENNLVMNSQAPAWERLVLQGSYKCFTYRYTFGFLENIDSTGQLPYQRYIVGRALEYRNNRNLVLGLSEVSILAGINRPIDLAHLNPLAIEVEIEQNRRENVPGGNQSDNSTNAIWIANFDWLAKPQLRLAGSLLIDEFKMENSERKSGQPDQIAYFGHIAWTPVLQPVGLTFFSNFTHIGTYTFRHCNGYCNFVNRNEPLGNPLGSDGEVLTLGVRSIFKRAIMTEIEYNNIRYGSNTINSNPYLPLIKAQATHFPSGVINRRNNLTFRMWLFLNRNIQISLSGENDIQRNLNSKEGRLWTLMLRVRLP